MLKYASPWLLVVGPKSQNVKATNFNLNLGTCLILSYLTESTCTVDSVVDYTTAVYTFLIWWSLPLHLDASEAC